ncbi:MAG: TlpA family protein disulfide reductase [Desulfovibrionales bacterium]
MYRYPPGYFGWMEYKGLEPIKPDVRLEPGDLFPACRLSLMLPGDGPLLGLPEGTKSFSLASDPLEYLFVVFVSSRCHTCMQELPEYGGIWEMIRSEESVKGRIGMFGLGAGDGPREVMRVRRDFDVQFPLIPDQDGDIFVCLGEVTLPALYFLGKEPDGSYRVLSRHLGPEIDIREVGHKLPQWISVHGQRVHRIENAKQNVDSQKEDPGF